MSLYTYDFVHNIIGITSAQGQAGVDCQTLYNDIAAVQASSVGICFPPIASASGKDVLSLGVQVAITVNLLNNWQIQFAPGNYVASVTGGNLVGGVNNDPFAYSPGVQVINIQSANATMVGQNLAATVATIAAQVQELWNVGGLNSAAPLTTTDAAVGTPGSITTGTMALTVTDSGSAVTVQRTA